MKAQRSRAERLDLLRRLVAAELKAECRNRTAFGGFDVFANLLLHDLQTDSRGVELDSFREAVRLLARYARSTPVARQRLLERLVSLPEIGGAAESPPPLPSAPIPNRAGEPQSPSPMGRRARLPVAPIPDRADDKSDEKATNEEHEALLATNDVSLDTPVTFLKGVGPRRAELLERLGIRTVNDLLWHVPFRYEDRSNPRPVAELEIGKWQAFKARVKKKSRTGRFGRSRALVIVEDASGELELVWFSVPFVVKTLEKGREYHFFGRPTTYRGRRTVANPDFEAVDDSSENGTNKPLAPDEGERPSLPPLSYIPVYPNTEGLPQKFLRRLIGQAAVRHASRVGEVLPERLLEEKRFLGRSEALQAIHRPRSCEEARAARDRLGYEELFLMQMALAVRRHRLVDTLKSPAIVDLHGVRRRVQEALGFRFTGAQTRVLDQIEADLAKERPMARLLQGDVGSGKTAVALTSLLLVCGAGHQGVLMAPTEILAEQHFLSVRRVCEEFGVEVRLVIGGQGKRDRQTALDGLASGTVGIAVGTHALIEEGVDFRSLGLVVVDEQHRFGVAQRNRLVSKGIFPNVLVMTATPIPRTLSLTLYGDLDISALDELPPGRQPILTRWLSPSKVENAYRLMDREFAAGRQAFIVCPLVDESEEVRRTNVLELHRELSSGRFAHRRVGLLHGQLKPAAKDLVMASFRAGELDLLVATTVVEVGVDVPNATVMAILDADAFGLAQLHQLRGRIGRGAHPSQCLLVAASRGPLVRSRLSILVDTQDGFEIARRDLEIRGPGEFFGTRQSGLGDLKVANLITDVELLEQARSDATRLLARDPDFLEPDHATLRRVVEDRHRALVMH